MPVWQLDPFDPKSNNWRASTYNRRVIIRAPDEQRAREIANLAFGIIAEHIHGRDTPILPWLHADVVKCQEIEAGPYEEDGEDEIVDPSEYDNESRR